MPAFAGKRLVEKGSLTEMSVISLIRTEPTVQQTTPMRSLEAQRPIACYRP